MTAKLTTMLGGPYSFQKCKLNHCMKTMKIRAKNQFGHYERSFPEADFMKWKESEKRWYLIDSDVKLTTEKLDKLGCWGIIEPTIHWSREYTNTATLVRRVGIDIDCPFSAFEMMYAEHIKYISEHTYQTIEDFRYKK